MAHVVGQVGQHSEGRGQVVQDRQGRLGRGDLGGGPGGLQAHLRQDLPLEVLGVVEEQALGDEGAHRPRELPAQASQGPLDLEDLPSQSVQVHRADQSEGQRFGVLTVGAPDLQGSRLPARQARQFPTAPAQGREDQALDSGAQPRQVRVGQDVIGGGAQVDKGPDGLGALRREDVDQGLEVVVDPGLLLAEIIQTDPAGRLDRLRDQGLRQESPAGQDLQEGQLDLQAVVQVQGGLGDQAGSRFQQSFGLEVTPDEGIGEPQRMGHGSLQLGGWTPPLRKPCGGLL